MDLLSTCSEAGTAYLMSNHAFMLPPHLLKKIDISFAAERKKESYKSYSAFVLIGRKKMPNARVSTSKSNESG